MTREPEVFIQRDEDYFTWLAQHPQGYVLNCYLIPTANFLVLHRATCFHIQRWEGRTLTGGAFSKACSDSEETLRNRAVQIGGAPRWCRDCHGC